MPQRVVNDLAVLPEWTTASNDRSIANLAYSIVTE
jgi:hypothetical protein